MKVLVIIDRSIILRNFISTNSFKNLIDKNEVCFAFNDDLKNRSILKKYKKKFFYKVNSKEKNNRISLQLSTLFFWKYRNRSKTFIYRYLRMIEIHHFYNNNLNIFKKIFKFIRSIIGRKNFWYTILPLISLFNVKNFVTNYYLKKIEIPEKLTNYLNNNKVDLIVLPSSTIDPITMVLDKLAQINNSKMFVLINNWDNLSSKGSFWYKPDLLGVWGRQTKEHAIKIQSINSKKIHIMGSPAYTNYFKFRKKKLSSPFKFKYILFAAPTLAFDEIDTLKKIDIIMEKNNKIFNKIKVVYRPHPFRQPRNCKDDFFHEKFKHIVLDKQSLGYYPKGKPFFPDLSYYPKLLQNSEIIITPLSTMLLESIIFYKKVLVIAHDDNYHFTTPKRNLENFEHLKIINNNNIFSFSYTNEDLENLLIKTFKKRKLINRSKIDELRDKILHKPNYSYAYNLNKIVNKLSSEK